MTGNRLPRKYPVRPKASMYSTLANTVRAAKEINLTPVVPAITGLKGRMVFVEYPLLVFTYNYKTRFIHTYELLQHLNSHKYENYTEHRFRSLVVGPVRDEGVLIVSSSAGYKLPCSTRGIYNF
ncbi:hypothetical protein [Pontibacter pamirensis]|uniref:hypothetical protein n=1 Tax=Pontibacter pamirensis TaxID=2562824 RepID=UPI00138A2A48|nr:hypothetical protein [Pontibacter pamirensis]